ncbi:MAG TPA: GNAT family N-acetyltransferase [Candidatus Merdisoma merdipullorum]|nr:GNAT family N-acetyltransferase [Candidatus Merdisoma merdipullorum]
MSIYRTLMTAEHAPISRGFQVNPEHCNNPGHYETYISQDCFADQKQGMGVTHAFIDEDENSGTKKIAGYITLRGSSLIMESGEDYKLGYPALEISELAVDKDYENQGLGTEMVKFAIGEAVELNEERIGFQYVILCADPEAVGFYQKLGFNSIRQLQEIPREHRNSSCVPMMMKIATV